MLRLCGVLLYITVVVLQVSAKKKGDDFASKIFQRINVAYTKAAEAIPKKINVEEVKLVRDGSKKLAAGIKTTTNKLIKWHKTLHGKISDLDVLEGNLRNISGTINRAANFLNLRKAQPDLDLIDVLTSAIEGFKYTVEDFVKSLRTKTGKVRASAEDVTKAFEKTCELFVADMKKATRTKRDNRLTPPPYPPSPRFA